MLRKCATSASLRYIAREIVGLEALEEVDAPLPPNIIYVPKELAQKCLPRDLLDRPSPRPSYLTLSGAKAKRRPHLAR